VLVNQSRSKKEKQLILSLNSSSPSEKFFHSNQNYDLCQNPSLNQKRRSPYQQIEEREKKQAMLKNMLSYKAGASMENFQDAREAPKKERG
jgi:hypothetical protein